MRRLLKRFINTLKSKYLYYYLIGSFILILSFNFKIFYLLLILYLIIFKRRYNLYLILISFTLIFLIYQYRYPKPLVEVNNTEYLIVDRETTTYSNKYLVKKGRYKYFIISNNDYKVGSYLLISGTISPFNDLSSPNTIKSSEYYKSKGIYGTIINYEIKLVSKYNYLYYLYDKSLSYDQLIFFGKNKEIAAYSNLNIYYLISLSGVHTYFLLKILNYILFHLDISENIQVKVRAVFLLILLLISGFTLTMIRILIYKLLKYIKKLKDINISNYSLLNLTFLILIILMPYLMNSKSLLISYVIVNFIVLFNNKFNSSNYLIKGVKMAFYINILLIPITNSINIIGIILNPLLMILLVYIMLPVELLMFILNINYELKIYRLIKTIINRIGLVNYNIILPKLSLILIILFISLYIYTIITKKRKLLKITLLILITLIPAFKKYTYDFKLYFLDVGQGDASVYISRDEVIVIDAYGGVSNLLQSEGIVVIDYLIITHSHLDHLREVDKLIENFYIKNLVISYYDNYDLNFNNNIIKINSYQILKLKCINIEFLSPTKNYNDSNNNSLVLKLYLPNKKQVLYSGDIEYKGEIDLINIYGNNLKSDIYQVSHHGSNTSNNLDLLLLIKPEVSIISVGENNKFNLPNKLVINNLNIIDSKVYRTDKDGTILYFNNKFHLI